MYFERIISDIETGGGFGLGAFPGHVQFLASCMEKVPGKLVVAFLEYGQY